MATGPVNLSSIFSHPIYVEIWSRRRAGPQKRKIYEVLGISLPTERQPMDQSGRGKKDHAFFSRYQPPLNLPRVELSTTDQRLKLYCMLAKSFWNFNEFYLLEPEQR